MATDIGGIPFDVNQTSPVASAAGWTRANRKALKDEGLVSFRHNFVKKIVKTKVSSHLQVSSFAAREIENKNNFFNCIGAWSQSSLRFDSWFRTHCVKGVFNILREEEVDDPANPGNKIKRLVEVGDLFQMWNTVTLDEVYDLCVIMMTKSTEELEAQNLNLSWEFLMENIDEDLQATVISEISKFTIRNADASMSGPMAYHVIANRIIRTTESLAHNVVTGLMDLGLVHFKGENVTDCVAVLRNVLLFLAFDTSRSQCPPTIMSILTDVFLRSSVPVFVNHVRTLKDFHESKIDTPEKLFTEVQDYYDKLLTKPNGWVRTTKTKAAFMAELPELAAIMDSVPSPHTSFTDDVDNSGEKKPSASSKQPPPSTDGKPMVDRKGNPIDRTPPKSGESTRRKSASGRNEYWCSHEKCGRWGSHDINHHDEWYAQYKERQKKAKAQKAAEKAANADKQGEPPSMHAATFCRPILKVLRDPYDSDMSF